jgi:hypothetical protein
VAFRVTPFRSKNVRSIVFYDLTAILNFGDYEYQFRNGNEGSPVIEGTPRPGFVPYDHTTFTLERRGTTYVVTTITYHAQGQQREAEFREYEEIAPGRFRPRRLVLQTDSGRTELTFRSWGLDSAGPELFTGTALETRSLTVPITELTR